MRGVASGDNGNHSGSLPSVGQYLDEQPITTIQGALDIHIYDIERVERSRARRARCTEQARRPARSASSPTSLTRRASAPATTCRGITSPDGDEGYIAEGYVNLPITDTTAVRLVGWYEHDAGYIDNVKGSMTFPTSGITMTNYEPGHNFAKDNYNDVDTYGGRAHC